MWPLLQVVPRSSPRWVEKASPGTEAFAEIAAAVAFASSRSEIPRPQRFEQLAKKYGTVVWVYACANRKGQDVASVPLKVLRRGDQGVEEVAREHPLGRLLRLVNPFLTSFDLIDGTSQSLDLFGNAYWLLFRTRRGLPAEIWPIRPELVTVLSSPTDFIQGYRIRSGGEAFDFGREDVIQFRMFNPLHDYYGLAPLVASWSSAILEEEAQVWNRGILANAGRLDGMLLSDQPVTEPQAREAAQRFREQFAGPRNAGRVMVLGRGLDYKAVATTPRELDFVLSRKLTREEILAAFGMRGVLLGLETGDIGRRSEQIRDYFFSTVRARIMRIVGALNEFLVPAFREEGLEIVADLEAAILPYEDREALARADALDIQNRILVPNEVRARRGLPPVAGGDTVLVPISMVPLSEAGQFAFTPPGPAIAPASGKALGGGNEADRTALWEALDAKALAHERPFHAGVLRAFRAAQDRMAALIREGTTPERALGEALTTLKLLLRRHAEAQLPTILEAGWDRAVDAVLARQRRGKGILDIAFSLAIPLLAQYLGTRPVQYGDLIAASLSPEFRLLLGDLANQGASIDQMAQAVSDRFDQISEARARTIARTEVIAASNLGTMTAYQESGEVQSQEWLTARDERVRATHRAADGQIADLGDTFEVGRARLRYPADPEGPPEEIINCRCVALPVLSKK